MYGYVYKITNLINNKIYIGLHKSNSFDESYWGSGSYIRKAINKYGLENFKQEIIDLAEDNIELNSKEEYWIEYYFKLNASMYNLKLTSIGGDTFSYADEEHLKLHKERIGNSVRGRVLSEDTKLKMSNSQKGKLKSKESILKMILSQKKSHRHWYTNGLSGNENNILISEGDTIPEGFYRGRTYSSELKAYIKEKTIEGNNKHNKVTWNKGLTKETDERVRKYGESISLTRKSKKINIDKTP